VQLQTTAEILQGLGYAIDAVELVESDAVNNACTVKMPDIQAATYAGFNEKRRVAFMALDHLFSQSPAPQDILSLSAGAPFGTLQVDTQSCTLCLSCTSVCPTHAVYAGTEEPKLLFNEAQCVQCGICTSACPEQAITLQPRLLVDPELRQRHVTLHEEPALCCVSCGKPFATQSVVGNMLAKLEDHWMFQNERAKRRLMMCEDCRIVDIAQDPEAMQQGFMAPNRQ
jgi:ferredoxin